MNGRGFRILTGGIGLVRYEKNPVLLYMHERGTVIGQMRDLRIEDGALTGEPWFDEATDLSRQLKEQYEAGSVCACSMGVDVLDVVEIADEPTVTSCELFEVSLVDVPENANTVTLRHEGASIDVPELVTLAKGGVTGDDGGNGGGAADGDALEEIGVLLGLDNEDGTSVLDGASIVAGVKALLSKVSALESSSAALETVNAELVRVSGELSALQAEHDRVTLSHIEKAVSRAIDEQRIVAGRRSYYVELGKKVGLDVLEGILADIPRPGRIIETLVRSDGDGGVGGVTRSSGPDGWKKLSDVPLSDLVMLKKEDPSLYAALYEAEYGVKLGV